MNRDIEEYYSWLKGHDKYQWVPDDLLLHFSKAMVHFVRELDPFNLSDIPDYRMRNIREYVVIKEDYLPSWGYLSRIAKRKKAELKNYKRSQADGYREQTNNEIKRLWDHLNLTLNWTMPTAQVKRLQTKMAEQRAITQQQREKVKENKKMWEARDQWQGKMFQNVTKAVDEAGGQWHGWDPDIDVKTLYTPLKKGKISFEQVPVVLQTARILQEEAGELLEDSRSQLLKASVVIVAKGHENVLDKIQKHLLEGSDLFKAQLYDCIVKRFYKAGFIIKKNVAI